MPGKRIVLRHLSGLNQIVGVLSGDVAPGTLPKSLEAHEVASQRCVLEKVEARYVVYRECAEPENDGA